MAWDFSTDPDFQRELDWIRDLVTEEIEPLDLIRDRLSAASWRELTDPLKQQVKDRGLWAAHLDPDHASELTHILSRTAGLDKWKDCFEAMHAGEAVKCVLKPE